MSDLNTSVVEQTIDARATWATPEVVTMVAGDAANAVGAVADDAISES